MGQVGTGDSAALTCSKFCTNFLLLFQVSQCKPAPFRLGVGKNKAGGRGGDVSETPVTVQNGCCVLYEYYLATKMNLCFHGKDPNLLINYLTDHIYRRSFGI